MRCSGTVKRTGAQCRRHCRAGGDFCAVHVSQAKTIRDNELDICTICQDAVTDLDAYRFRCKHVFCVACIFRWLATKRSCPNCGRIPDEEEIPIDLSAPPDGRMYEVGGALVDFTDDMDLDLDLDLDLDFELSDVGFGSLAGMAMDIAYLSTLGEIDRHFATFATLTL